MSDEGRRAVGLERKRGERRGSNKEKQRGRERN